MTSLIDRLLTFSRSAAFAGWLMGAWGILEGTDALVWPPTKETIVALIGLTIATFGRSVLADAKVTPPPPPPTRNGDIEDTP